MNLDKKELLTPNEVTFLLIGIMLGASITTMPNSVIVHARQSGWISVVIGAVYPLYVALLSIFVSNKHPKDNILVLSTKYFNKTLGTLLNFLFLLSFLSYLPTIISFISLLVRTEILQSINVLQFGVVILLASVYAASKGIKVLGKISTISFFMVIAIIFPTVMILKEGSILNVQPLFNVGIVNILKDSEATIYDYALLELIFLIYPFINDSKKIKSAVLKTVAITCLLYTWIAFITIYYLGVNIIPKTLYSFITVTEGIKFETITNFKYIFISFWIFIAAKSVAIFSYFYIFILNDIKRVKNEKFIYLIVSITILIISLMFYKDYTARLSIVKYTSRISVCYNLFYITLISAAVKLESRRKHEKV